MPFVRLPDAGKPRSQAELAHYFAQRVVQANPPEASYLTPAPNRLYAIPVLEVELNADGSVRKITVLRRPSTGDETTRRAIAAVHRAAPFGPVGHLPRPWKVIEAFLFDDSLRFKPRQLDLQ
jgi:hypothetical protein